MEHEISLPHSQVPATCPYTKPHQSVHASPFHFLKIHFSIILPSTPRYSKRSISLRSPHPIPICTSPHPIPICTSAVTHTCYMPHPVHPSWFDHLNTIWWRVEIIKLLVVLIKLIVIIYKFIFSKEFYRYTDRDWIQRKTRNYVNK